MLVAAKNGHAGAIKALTDLGAEVDVPTVTGAAAVPIAAQNGQLMRM